MSRGTESSVVTLDGRTCKDPLMHAFCRVPLPSDLERAAKGDCPALNGRALTLIAGIGAAPADNRPVLVEMKLRWNATKEISIMVKMVATSDGEWEPMCSVVRVH
jgi:hypothetical protein